MLRRIFIGLVWILVMLNGVGSSQEYSDIDVFVESVYPSVIYAGDDIEIYLRIINRGTKDMEIEEISFDLPENFEIISYAPLDYKRTLCGGCSLKYDVFLRSSQEIKAGRYGVEVKVHTKDYILMKTIYLDVKSRDVLYVDFIDGQGKINGNGWVVINLTNKGDSDIGNIKLYLHDSEVMLKDSAYVYLDSLKSGESVLLNLSVVVSKNSIEGMRAINLTISYKSNSEKVVSYVLPFNVLSNGELSISSISLDPLPVIGKVTDLIVRVENTNYGKVHNIRVSVDGDTISYVQKEYYLGTLDSGEDAAAIFTIIPHEVENPLKIKVEYEVNNQPKMFEEHYVFYSKRETMSLYYVLGLVVLGTLLFWYWRRRGKDKNDEED